MKPRDDWPTLLRTHEHTHVLHLEQTGGSPAVIAEFLDDLRRNAQAVEAPGAQ